MRHLFLVLLLSACASAQELGPGRKFTTLERLRPERLAAVNAARQEFARQRKQPPSNGVYEDFRAVLHVHAEDAGHTKGTRQQVLEAAKATGVHVVMFTDHRGPKPDTWRGLRDGVLFIPGSEEDHELRFPHADGALRFLSHLEERPNASPDGFDGLEIYNRHTDSKDEAEFNSWFFRTMKEPGAWGKLVEAHTRYPDEVFAASADYQADFTAYWDRQLATRPFTAIAANDAHRNQIYNDTVFDPYEVSFRNASTHILARELTESEIRKSLREGRAYVSHDWLCDPTGFAFVAANNLGVFEMGDRVPQVGGARVTAQLPVAARLKLFHNGKVIQEASGDNFTYTAKEPGAYRLEAWLEVDGELRPWIYSNAIFLDSAPPSTRLPSNAISDNVEVRRDIPYADGKPEDADKHKLDLYIPKGRSAFPVLFFMHGGSWRSGDRSRYVALGNRFASEGIGVVIPSYRLAPANLHPAQIEDTAAAFAWTVANIQRHGGDPKRIFVAGHSAGAHLISLLTVDPRYLAKHALTNGAIAGAVSLSGPYSVEMIVNVFTQDPEVRRQASPIHHVQPGLASPPFLITYCQWDYPFLPAQARQFHRALESAGVRSTLVYIPGENHISEIVNIVRPGDPTAEALLAFLNRR